MDKSDAVFSLNNKSKSDPEDIDEGVHFIQKRPRNPNNTKRQRPLSLSSASQIISNPKLVKSLQDLEAGQRLHVSNLRINSSHGKFQEVQHFDCDDQELSQKKGIHKYLGILLALFASLVFSLGSIIVKSISKEYHPYSLSVWTFQGILLPSLVILIYERVFRGEKVFKGIWPILKPNKIKNFLLILIRALFGAGGTVLKVYSLQFMTAADSTIIAFSSPVFVVIIAWIFLDEKCGVVPILTALIVLVGVGAITRPPWLTGEKEFDSELLTGCAMAFSCMLLGTFVVVILRYLRDVHYALITFIYGLLGTIISLSLCFIQGSFQWPICLKHWLLAVCVASTTFVGQSTLTLALQYEQAGPIALIRTSEIIFTFGWQLLFFYVLPDALSVIGALIVTLGVFIITTRKWIGTLPNSHRARKLFWILLL